MIATALLLRSRSYCSKPHGSSSDEGCSKALSFQCSAWVCRRRSKYMHVLVDSKLWAPIPHSAVAQHNRGAICAAASHRLQYAARYTQLESRKLLASLAYNLQSSALRLRTTSHHASVSSPKLGSESEKLQDTNECVGIYLRLQEEPGSQRVPVSFTGFT